VLKRRFVKFQNVRSITLFIESNQEDEDSTLLQKIQLLGSLCVPPLPSTGLLRIGRIRTRVREQRTPAQHLKQDCGGARNRGYTYAAKVWDLSLVQGPFPTLSPCAKP
jgi:hypothetical protein